MPKINREEYKLLKGLDEKWRWIARDLYDKNDGNLFVYPEKPFKNHYSRSWVCGIWIHPINIHLFQFIQWEDEEPHNIAELIEEYEDSTEHVSHVVNERVKVLGKAWSESEETEVKSKQELIEKWESAIESAEFYGKGKEEELISYMKDFVSDLNQLDEPEVLSQEWIDKHKMYCLHFMQNGYFISEKLLQNLLVPKQEEVDRAYKDGYEKGKEHATRDDEPETVASVMADFFGAAARLKEVLTMEVEEMEE